MIASTATAPPPPPPPGGPGFPRQPDDRPDAPDEPALSPPLFRTQPGHTCAHRERLNIERRHRVERTRRTRALSNAIHFSGQAAMLAVLLAFFLLPPVQLSLLMPLLLLVLVIMMTTSFMEHNLDLYNPYGSYEIAKEALEEPGLVQTEAPSLRAYKTPYVPRPRDTPLTPLPTLGVAPIDQPSSRRTSEHLVARPPLSYLSVNVFDSSDTNAEQRTKSRKRAQRPKKSPVKVPGDDMASHDIAGDDIAGDDTDLPVLALVDDEETAIPGLAGDETASPSNKTPHAVLYKDKNGLIRVGPQPLQVLQRPVWFAPSKRVHTRIHRALFDLSDHKFSEMDSTILQTCFSSVEHELRGSLENVANDYVKGYDDYTGTMMRWDNGPEAASIEGIYPFVVSAGQLGYHFSPNVGMIPSALNWTKGRHPPVVLPLLAQWLVVHDTDEYSFTTKKARWSWIFNALTNAGPMRKEFGLVLPHDKKRDLWLQWTTEKQRAVLHTLRTGIKGPELDQAFQDISQLFVPRQHRGAGAIDWDNVYDELVRVAGHHGCPYREFEYCFTIPASGDRGRVFYPFHVLSMPQAKAMGWNWAHIMCFCRDALKRLRGQCNRHAEAQGLGEANMDEVKLMYWMAAHFAQEFRSVKRKYPTADLEQIRFYILDRWGLPIIPWVYHACKASLCKKQDHGIAMKFGLLPHDKFDPVAHFDMSCSTITIDSQATNMAMFNYPTHSWDSIRQLIAMVPLHHPFWRVHQSLGTTDWCFDTNRDESIGVVPLPPVISPNMSMTLAPIDLWISGDGSMGSAKFICHLCGKHFAAAGRLVHHCRTQHRPIGAPDTSTTDDGLDDYSREFWDSRRFECRECSKAFRTPEDRYCHEKRVHSDERPYVCDEDGCGMRFKTSSVLTVHKTYHFDERLFACRIEGCEKTFQNQNTRWRHEKEVHSDERKHVCNLCNKAFTSAGALNVHRKTHFDERPYECDIDGCGKTFKTSSGLSAHKKVTHSDERPYKCDAEGCGKSFKIATHLRKHRRTHDQ
ncbi:Zinc finger protein-like protein [Hapsidospora chrysogenum ATCC 11550]|uniref:Zinc finger protein-like protein n=1 Tax=Hapsidospora chrysogenum (strain ATCC 11550 / CBS 779.69 / DSM 880 / IAM 14645 / JCM 23072 / IMI 49137) TaxID=857340 RepID=A0A086STU5_HAPC1|nr:Zinc finger protein-like protein [Hapsidospora chrysogenum ATCC 11550]